MGRVCCMTGTAVKMNPHRCPGYRSSAAPRATPLRCAASSAALCVLGRLLPSSKAECLCPGPACAAKTGSAPPWGALRLAAVLDALAGGCPAAWLVTTCTLSQNGYPFRISRVDQTASCIHKTSGMQQHQVTGDYLRAGICVVYAQDLLVVVDPISGWIQPCLPPSRVRSWTASRIGARPRKAARREGVLILWGGLARGGLVLL